MKTRVAVQIRWLIKRDMVDVLRIDEGSFDNPWSEEDFMVCLRQRNCIGMVAEYENSVVGYMIYQLHKHSLHILNFAVAPWARHVGVGTQMIEKLVNKLSQQRRTSISLEVRESNLPAQLFYRRMGFKARCVLRDYYHDTDEAAYRMRFDIDPEDEPHKPVNRVAKRGRKP